MFLLTADEAREITTTTNPIELLKAKTIEDTFLYIRSQAKKGFPNAIKTLVGDQQFYVHEIIKTLKEAGFTVEAIKEPNSTLLSISWL